MKIFLFLGCACLFPLCAADNLKSLYSSLDPLSVSQHLAFYELYSDTEEGKLALQRAWKLLNHGKRVDHINPFFLPKLDVQSLVSLVTRQSFDPPVKLAEDQMRLICELSSHLANRKLKGSTIWTKEELLALPTEEIDLGRGLLINQFDDSDDFQQDIRQYEASIDLMALQIQARLAPDASAEDKIREINRFIFHEMQFRFPPHSLYVQDIDLYTFLPSVLDCRQGVCLGVSILYLCIAQRLDLPLEIITPPGHIYVRYRTPEKEINIETTARGVNLPTDTYLGINTRKLELRNLKEVIGMAFVNQASVFWGKGEYETTVLLYEKARPYLPHDPLLKMLLGINYLFVGKKKEGKKLLQEIRHVTFEDAVSPESLPEDYLSGKVDIEGLKAVFMHVDEKRTSIEEKQKELAGVIKKYPHFRGGLLQQAICWLQLGRGSEALDALQKYHLIDPNSATVEYYLSVLCMERYDYNRAWQYLQQAETLTRTRGHNPKALKALRSALKRSCPEP